MPDSFPKCRFCGSDLKHSFVDLGNTPLANAYLSRANLDQPEPSFPLHARICQNCLLVQVDPSQSAEEIFSDYAYFSSFSDSWLAHCRNFAEGAIRRFGLTAASTVVEVASNDGYLLQYFAQAGIATLGIEPAANVAEVARAKGIATEVAFFGRDTAAALVERGIKADLICANNVIAHVPDINDFVAGFGLLLKPDGVLSVEAPHILNLIAENQFDTIYHEHFYYYSFLAMERILAHHGLTVFDVERLPTHGGSLRVLAARADSKAFTEQPAVAELRRVEREAGLDRLDTYAGFGQRVEQVKADLLAFLRQAKAEGKSVAAYGAAAKGNTLLNVCGVDGGLIAYVVDRNPHKQDCFLPGSHLAIRDPAAVFETRPDYLLILPWNIKGEIMAQMAGIRDWGGRFVTAIPRLAILP